MAKQIGRYEIKREIGRGGMATVYLAFDPRFQRQVAIKVLPRQFTHDPDFQARFETEAQMIAALEHKAIVPVYDFGKHGDAPFLVMRYMAGGSLHDRMRSELLSLQEIASTLARLAPALDAAHARGIIHRDLKPANVLFDEYDDPYLADFGIARMAEATQTMTVVGTPAYMSPEQVQGDQKLDGRSDIYALGVMLFELLTGQQPYLADTPTKQMMAHVLQPVPDILTVKPELPEATQMVIEKSMAKGPEDRFATAGELTNSVSALAAEERSTREGMEKADPSTFVAATVEEPAAIVADEPPSDWREEGEEIVLTVADPTAIDTPPDLSVKNRSEISMGFDLPKAAAGTRIPNFPSWVWWVGALALLVIGILGLRVVKDVSEQTTGSDMPEGAEVAVAIEETATLSSIPSRIATPYPTISPVPSGLTDVSETTDIASEEYGEIEARFVERAPGTVGNLTYYDDAVEYKSEYLVYISDDLAKTDDVTAYWKLGWDQNNLYVWVFVEDDILVLANNGNSTLEGDSVDLQLDTQRAADFGPRLSPDDYQIILSPGNFKGNLSAAFRYRGTDDGSLVSHEGHNIQTASYYFNEGYAVDAAIPWHDLGITPEPGDLFGIALNVSDYDNPGVAVREVIKSHIPNRRFDDPTSWGTLRLN